MSMKSQFYQIANQTKGLLQNALQLPSLYSQAREKGPFTSRREIQMILQTRKDLMKLFPSLVYICLPFTIPTLPVIVKQFPNAMPSFLLTQPMIEGRNEAVLKRQRSIAGDGIDMVIGHLNGLDLKSRFAIDRDSLVNLLKSKKKIEAVEYLQYHQLISTHLKLNQLPSPLVRFFYKFNGGSILFPLKKAKLLQDCDWILKDDLLIKDLGFQKLNQDEIIDALMGRVGGVPLSKDSIDRPKLVKLLQERVDFQQTLLKKLDLLGVCTVFYINRLHMASLQKS